MRTNGPKDRLSAYQRRERRYPCAATEVAVKTPTEPSFNGLVLDVSKSGIRLRTSRTLQPGLRVTVSFAQGRKQTMLHAEVRFCKDVPDGSYELGLEIEDFIATPSTHPKSSGVPPEK